MARKPLEGEVRENHTRRVCAELTATGQRLGIDATRICTETQPEPEEPEGPYSVQIDVPGCDHCAAGRQYSAVFHDGQPDELAESTSYDDYDFACEIQDMLNAAYLKGVASVKI